MTFSALKEPYQIDCGICFQSQEEDAFEHEKVHVYCGGCLREWVKISPVCPTCRADIDTTNLIGHRVVLKDKGDMDFEFPEEYAKYGIPAAIGMASLIAYDAVVNGSPIVIGFVTLAISGVFAQMIHPDFDQHGQSIRG